MNNQLTRWSIDTLPPLQDYVRQPPSHQSGAKIPIYSTQRDPDNFWDARDYFRPPDPSEYSRVMSTTRPAVRRNTVVASGTGREAISNQYLQQKITPSGKDSTTNPRGMGRSAQQDRRPSLSNPPAFRPLLGQGPQASGSATPQADVSTRPDFASSTVRALWKSSDKSSR